jgi:hypothetical protein
METNLVESGELTSADLIDGKWVPLSMNLSSPAWDIPAAYAPVGPPNQAWGLQKLEISCRVPMKLRLWPFHYLFISKTLCTVQAPADMGICICHFGISVWNKFTEWLVPGVRGAAGENF